MYDEEQLILLAKNGSPEEKREAFNLLITEHLDRLRALGTRLMGKSQDVDDVITLTTMKAMRSIDDYVYNPPFWAWLSRIHFNACYDNLRAIQREQKKIKFNHQSRALGPEQENSLYSIPAPQSSVSKNLEIDIKLERVIQQALGALSEKHRNILLMVFINEMKYQEAADLLNVEIGTVMSRISNAKKFFIENLIRMGIDKKTIHSFLSQRKDEPILSKPTAHYKQEV